MLNKSCEWRDCFPARVDMGVREKLPHSRFASFCACLSKIEVIRDVVSIVCFQMQQLNRKKCPK